MERRSDLEHQYACSRWTNRPGTPDDIIISHCSFAESRSREAREKLRHTRISYGPTEEQAIDWFECSGESTSKPIFVFIHGGYWQEMSLDSSAYMAECFVEQGFTVASLGYDLCPSVTMSQLVAQVEFAIRLVLKRSMETCPVYICGHSAGGHLTAYMSTLFSKEVRIRGYVAISGVFDLEPLLHTSINEKVGMDLSSARSLSPQHLDSPEMATRTCVLLAYGQQESPAFKTQSQQFAHKLAGSANIHCNVVEIAGVDHFTIIESLSEPKSDLTRLILDMFKL